MILVIADDLSGAAELAGIAASLGYTAEVHTTLDPTRTAQVIAVDAATRFLPPADAAYQVRSIIETARPMAPDWIYKKTDSALRGNIASELEAAMRATGKHRTMFIPANPDKQRCIRNGLYLIANVPLHQTLFARDPHHPRRTSDVISALGEASTSVHSIRSNEPATGKGIFIPDIEIGNDLKRRAVEMDDNALAAGAAEFFTALLNLESIPPTHAPALQPAAGRSLFVCGSQASWDQGIANEMEQRRIPVFTIEQPPQVTAPLHAATSALIGIGHPPGNATIPEMLLHQLIESAVPAVTTGQWEHVFLEGGATASAFIERLMWHRLKALPAELSGVGVLQPVGHPGAPTLFIKPGSYPWPGSVWKWVKV